MEALRKQVREMAEKEGKIKAQKQEEAKQTGTGTFEEGGKLTAEKLERMAERVDELKKVAQDKAWKVGHGAGRDSTEESEERPAVEIQFSGGRKPRPYGRRAN